MSNHKISQVLETFTKNFDIPVFKMSEKRERIALNAFEDYKNNKTKTLGDIENHLTRDEY